MRSLTIVLLLSSISVSALSVEGIDFPDQTTVGSTKLVLNGAGLRTKRKFGMNFKVYVGALYLVAKTQDAKVVINSTDTKRLELVFLRSVDASTLREAWTEGFDKNCKADCDAARASLKEFNGLMVDVKEKSRLTLNFTGQDVQVNMEGKSTKSGKLSGEAIRKALMAIFIGDEPPTAELKKALLGAS